jgi:Fe-S oxidoreductase
MNEFLRYENNQPTNSFDTIFNFSETEGILRMAEKCNGSGDCRKSHVIGGTMCPSYMATRNEKDTTRARANILREFLTRSPKENKFDHKEIYEVMDLCLSCKGCKSECPSNVDVATMKAEFLQHYYDANGTPLRAWAIGNISKLNALGSIVPGIANFVMHNKFTGGLLKKTLGMSPKRELPGLYKTTLLAWYKSSYKKLGKPENRKGKVYLFCDEFTNYNDTEIGIKAIKLLHTLGYEVEIPKHGDSGRTYLSKGLVRDAQKIAIKNVDLLKDIISSETPLLGIEPSAILSFKDEYPRLVNKDQITDAEKLGKNCFLIDEFLAKEADKGNIKPENFTSRVQKIKLHGHCHQKALGNVSPTRKILELPSHYSVELIPSGCCGMAGAFGYEEEHYEISQQVGELILFPAVRKADVDTLIAAPGTSCRHQIKDGTGKKALHPVEILFDALKN